ncbi:MAG TPA: hypothetical protein VN736_00385 [Candidatus Limnocylindrales bacterium]|nr:hypothetical protein [Candidatus Limnocylindrales bacterium]
MPIERFKEIQLNGQTFRVGRVPSDVGVWIMLQIEGRKTSDQEVYAKIKNHLFNLCSYCEEIDGSVIPKRIYADGKWLVPQLELDYDAETVKEIFEASMEFNFGGFFEKLLAKAKAALEASSDTGQ